MDVRVRVTPRSGRNEISGVRDDGVLLVRVTAPPEDGKANDAVRRVIAKAAGVAPSRVEVTRGHSAREKTVAIDADDDTATRAALGLLS
ncbi:MAG: DUF167 domain-containing protein [Baekduia sp.]